MISEVCSQVICCVLQIGRYAVYVGLMSRSQNAKIVLVGCPLAKTFERSGFPALCIFGADKLK